MLRSKQSQPAIPTEKPSIAKRDTQKKADHSDNRETNSSSETVISETTGSRNKEQPTHQDEEANSYDPRKDSLYRAYLWATIFGVAGAIIGVLVLLWQSALLRRSTQAARDAASATLLNAQATVGAERALGIWHSLPSSFASLGFLFSELWKNSCRNSNGLGERANCPARYS